MSIDQLADPEVSSRPEAACPKHMEYGPCGGVDFDGTCEVGDFRCVFLGSPVVRWSGIDRRTPVASAKAATSEAARMRALMDSRPILVSDLPARPMSGASIREVASILRGTADAVLAGDSGDQRVQFPPAYRARLIADAGMTPWTGLNCRDRNRVAIEGELAGLADVPTGAVHCVTGDHTATGGRPDAAPVFDLDSTEVAALAVAAGHLVSVGESPLTPPIEHRAARLVQKLRTGAEVCFINHCGGAAPARAFVDEVRGLGGDARFIACVPIVVSLESAALLASFTTLVLPEGYLDGIVSAADPRAAGIDAAVRMSLEFLEVGMDGVNLSGGAGGADELIYAEALAEISERIGIVRGGGTGAGSGNGSCSGSGIGKTDSRS